MSVAHPTTVPPLRRILWRLLWISAIGGMVLACVLAVVGSIVAGGGGDLLVSLIPAMISLGFGMAIPPVLGAAVGLAVVARPPRALRHERWAAAIGGAVGAFVSPVLFYPASLLLGVAVGAVIAVAVLVGYPLAVHALWRRAATD